MLYKKRFKLGLFLFFFIIITCFQSLFGLDINIDSLKKLSHSNNLETKVYALIKLSNYFSNLNDTNALNYALQAYSYIENLKNDSLIALTYKALAISYDNKGFYNVALKFYLLSQELFYKLNRKRDLITTLNNSAIIFLNQGNFTQAQKNYVEEIKIAEEINDTISVATSYSNLAQIQFYLKNIPKAYEYLELALNICKKHNHKYGLGLVYSNMANLEIAQKKYNKAEEYIKNAIKYFKEIDNLMGVGNAYSIYGNILFLQGNFKNAVEMKEKSISIFKSLNDRDYLATSYASLGQMYLREKFFDKALEYLLLAEKLFEEENYQIKLTEITSSIADAYYEKKDFIKAIEYLKKEIALKDKNYKKEHLNNLAEQEVIFEVDKKIAQIENLKKEKEQMGYELVKKEQIILYFIILFGIIVSSLILLTYSYIKRNKAYRELLKKNVEFAERTISQNNLENELILFDLEKEKVETQQQAPEIEKSRIISISTTRELIPKLLDLMENQKIYLDKQLTIDSLAEQLNTNRSYLSNIINDYFGKNFNNFINEYRVKEAILLFKNEKYQNHKLDHIATLCGFNNKTTFNTTFKKITGLTPSYFRKNIKYIDKESISA